MGLYSVDIEKVLLGEYWTNRYIVEATTLTGAHAIGANIVEIEQTVHDDVVTFTKYRTSTTVEDDDAYFITPINQPGAENNAGDYLPLFNVVRVDFAAAGGGRPSRKYLRLPLFEPQQSNGALLPGVVTFLQTYYADLLAALEGYVDVDGQELIAGSVSPFVGMRQLRRGSKRKLEPVLP